MITIPREICIDLDLALNKEWLVGNGIGGYASSTVAGVNTRRYHGYLVAALKPPGERTLLLANIDEEAEIDGRTYYLGANEYPDGKIHPGGFVHIEEFQIREGIPTTIFRLGDSALLKTVWLEHRHNTTYIRYTYPEGDGECCLLLHTMCNYRDYHSMTKGNFEHGYGVEPLANGCKVQANDHAKPFWLTAGPDATFTPTGVWYWNFVYRKEVERGYNETEDLYLPGVFRAVLQPGDSLVLVASTEPPEVTEPLTADAWEREQARQQTLLQNAGIKTEVELEEAASAGAPDEAFAAQLVRAADTFMVMRGLNRNGETAEMPTVLAGYHWFTEWGRDTMISLPGLSLPTGSVREANKTLHTFSLFAQQGLIPNNFPDAVGVAPQYNTADATLWMFAAVDALARATGNMSTARDLYPLLADIVAWHVRGTRFGIHVDPADGLLHAGAEGCQLTWMDARVGDWVVTPRIGKPVEINALWYNALLVMEKLRVSLGPNMMRGEEDPLDFNALAQQARDSFQRRFWYSKGGYLFDVIDGPNGDDSSLRPNQLLALYLSSNLVSAEQAQQALGVARQHLLTPYGLRTLSPGDPEYKGNYTGDRRERDGAYHQGTVWTWLLGPYFGAVRAIEGEEAARKELRQMLPTLKAHLADAGLGSISEIFDGDAPHQPRGCISQAWSVAELLRLVWGPERLL